MNRAHLLGNIGQDPELRMTGGGTAVLKFSLATSERWSDKTSGEKKEETQWHRCVMFGKRAEGLAKHLTKGSKIAVEGKIKYGSYENTSGDKVYTTDIVVDQVHFAGGGKGGQQGGASPYGGSYAPADGPADKAAPAIDDNDIPF